MTSGCATECFDLLRLPAVRYIKLAPEITAKMRSDKLSQAAITAVVQMARVMGMHTVAKRTETAAEQEWLTALGVDFIQSNALSPASPSSLCPSRRSPRTSTLSDKFFRMCPGYGPLSKIVSRLRIRKNLLAGVLVLPGA